MLRRSHVLRIARREKSAHVHARREKSAQVHVQVHVFMLMCCTNAGCGEAGERRGERTKRQCPRDEARMLRAYVAEGSRVSSGGGVRMGMG